MTAEKKKSNHIQINRNQHQIHFKMRKILCEGKDVLFIVKKWEMAEWEKLKTGCQMNGREKCYTFKYAATAQNKIRMQAKNSILIFGRCFLPVFICGNWQQLQIVNFIHFFRHRNFFLKTGQLRRRKLFQKKAHSVRKGYMLLCRFVFVYWVDNYFFQKMVETCLAPSKSSLSLLVQW